MIEPLRLGIVGLGEAVTEILPAYANDPRVKITAAADIRRSALERFAREFNAKAFERFEDLCQSPDVDVVYVATPHEFHTAPAVTALENRKHVIVEKPMALTLEDCDRMIASAEKHGVKLLCGHSHSYDSPVRKTREIIKSGELGRLCMINTWNYNDFMVRPYPDQAIKMSRGVVLNQGPHQVDIVRLLGGGMVRSVRAMAGNWDSSRPGEGSYTCYLEFEEGVPATLVFNGYGFFDTAELFWWIGEGGQPRYPGQNSGARKNYKGLGTLSATEREKLLEEMKERMRFGSIGLAERPNMPEGWEKGGYRSGPQVKHQQFFGLTLVSCEKGDLRQSPDGIYIYGDEKREVPIDEMDHGRKAEISEVYEAVANDKPTLHDGRWGKATVEVCLAILESTSTRREVFLSHQVPARD